MTVNEYRYKEAACATPDDVEADDVSTLQNAPQDSENLLGRVLAGEEYFFRLISAVYTLTSLRTGPIAVFTFVYLGQHAVRQRLVHCTSAFLANFPLFLSFKDPCQRMQSRTGSLPSPPSYRC